MMFRRSKILIWIISWCLEGARPLSESREAWLQGDVQWTVWAESERICGAEQRRQDSYQHTHTNEVRHIQMPLACSDAYRDEWRCAFTHLQPHIMIILSRPFLKWIYGHAQARPLMFRTGDHIYGKPTHSCLGGRHEIMYSIQNLLCFASVWACLIFPTITEGEISWVQSQIAGWGIMVVRSP